MRWNLNKIVGLYLLFSMPTARAESAKVKERPKDQPHEVKKNFVPPEEDHFLGQVSPLRRKDQRQITPGHILTPAVANIPGLGFTYGILGGAFNVAQEETDLLGFRFWGDLAGAGAGIVDLPIFSDQLTVNLFWNTFDKAAIESHRRGVKSNPKDKKYIVLDRFGLMLAQVNLRLFDRRLQFLAGANEQVSKLGAVRNKDGELITEGNGERNKEISQSVGMFLDLTDDRSDPRKGVSLEVYRYDRPPASSFNADFYQIETNFLGYLPVGNFSTWAFNFYRAQAVVQRKGETDAQAIKSKLGFQCEGLPEEAQAACQKTEEDFVAEQKSANQNGTAPPLGGTQRLRSYVTNRFYAAQTIALGSEFRWNLTEEFTPFDIFVASGVRTGVQLALFAEAGTVADSTSDLSKDWRHSVGGGVRFILASGFVVRLDLASGSEGTQPTLIFQYPWSVF